jgi:hypothetical protein
MGGTGITIGAGRKRGECDCFVPLADTQQDPANLFVPALGLAMLRKIVAQRLRNAVGQPDILQPS